MTKLLKTKTRCYRCGRIVLIKYRSYGATLHTHNVARTGNTVCPASGSTIEDK